MPVSAPIDLLLLAAGMPPPEARWLTCSTAPSSAAVCTTVYSFVLFSSFSTAAATQWTLSTYGCSKPWCRRKRRRSRVVMILFRTLPNHFAERVVSDRRMIPPSPMTQSCGTSRSSAGYEDLGHIASLLFVSKDSNKLHAPTLDRRARQDHLLDDGGLGQIVL